MLSLCFGSSSSSNSSVTVNAVTGNRISSQRIFNNAVNCYAVRINTVGVCIGVTTARSERDSCESYEHEN